MKHDEFKIGAEFTLNGRRYRCTDVGTRTATCIKIGPTVTLTTNSLKRELTTAQASADGWFRGPPYTLAESVVDEDDMPLCVPAIS